MLLDACRLALGTLTAVPVAPPDAVDRRRAGAAMVLAPLASAPLAAVLILVALVGHVLQLPGLVVALLALGAAVLGNRALHLDGLADTVDGMAASYDPERSLLVMRSGTSGPAGVVGIVLTVGLQAAGLAAVLTSPHPMRAAVLAGCALCVSRAALVACCSRVVPSARPGGLGEVFTRTASLPAVGLVWLTCAAVLSLVGAWAGLAWWRGALAVVVALVVVVIVVARAVRRLGGVTGDVFGASIELALATVLVALA